MAADVPEYYRHLASKSAKPDPESKPAAQAPPPPGPTPKAPRPPIPAAAEPTQDYRANVFTIQLPTDWTDRTVFTLTGPVTDGIQHNITITVSPEPPVGELLDFAEWQIRSLEEQLKGCRLLLKERAQLNDGTPAYRAIFVWWPTDDLRLYQEQLYVVHDGLGFTLTASFTKKTRKTIGPGIERAMLSFKPGRTV